jgi:hypothetical protein
VDLPDSNGFAPLPISGLQNTAADALPSVRLAGFEWRIFHRSTRAVAAK